MRIFYSKQAGVTIHFSPSELKTAQGVLQALYDWSKADFIKAAIDDITADLQPKSLPMINYHHLCSACFRDIDERDPNTRRVTYHDEKNGIHEVRWQCIVCKPINDKRPD